MENGNNILDNAAFASSSYTGVQLRDNSQRAKIALILLWIVNSLVVVMLVSDILQYSLLQEAMTGFVSEDAASSNDLRQLLLGVIFLIAYIVSIVFFIMWFRRAYFNLGLAGISKRFTDGWAAGAWFVPFVNLGRPYKIMNEIWEEKSLLIDRISPSNYNGLASGKAILGVWWALHLISGIIGRIEFNMVRKADTIDKLVNATTLSIVSDCTIILCGSLLIFIVRRVAAMEKEIYANQHLLGPQPVIA